jgi:glycine C-acetyltransferase
VFGVGTGSVRTIAGTMAMHMELERKLAEFKKVEAVVVFQSGFTANAGTVSAILTKEDVVISDELNHASIIDGCRLSRAAIKVFPHKDVDAARKIIKGLPAGQRKLLITDGVFSMDGDLVHCRSSANSPKNRLHHDGRRCPCERCHWNERPGTIDHFGRARPM